MEEEKAETKAEGWLRALNIREISMGEIGFLSQWLRTGAVLWVFCSPGEALKFRRVIFRGTRYSQLRWALLGLSNTEPFSLTSNSGLPDHRPS